MLAVEQLAVRYAGQPQSAVDGVSLALREGQIGALIGPSGCGKTTLLRAVAGLERASGGRIALQGETVTGDGRHVPPERRRIGMVFQDHALFPHLTVAGNAAYGLRHLDAAAQRARVARMLALVGLEALAGRYPHELSGGQQQRVALARSLAPGPRLLLLDEPFSNLDPALREHLAHEMRAIFQAERVTALFVTHDQAEAFAIADRVGVMHQGRLHQWAEAHAVYHRPATRFVAAFIGDGVFLPGEADAQAPGAVRTPLGMLRGDDAAASSSDEAAACDVLLRAEDVLHDEAAPLRAQVLRRAFRGASFLYTLRLPTGESVQAQLPPHARHAPGDWIGIRAAPRHLVRFARETQTD